MKQSTIAEQYNLTAEQLSEITLFLNDLTYTSQTRDVVTLYFAFVQKHTLSVNKACLQYLLVLQSRGLLEFT